MEATEAELRARLDQLGVEIFGKGYLLLRARFEFSTPLTEAYEAMRPAPAPRDED